MSSEIGSTDETAGGAPRTKRCPYCAETILADARKCRFCGSNVAPRPRWMGSPWLGAISIVIATAGGVAEVLSLVGVDERLQPKGFGPAPLGDAANATGAHLAVAALAVALGLAAVGAVLLVRRGWPHTWVALLAAGATALLVSATVRANYAVLALAAAFLAWGALLRYRPRGRNAPAER